MREIIAQYSSYVGIAAMLIMFCSATVSHIASGNALWAAIWAAATVLLTAVVVSGAAAKLGLI